MSKGNKLYKIFMTSMIVIIAGLLLATGIIAIQKHIKLKANIQFLPGVNVEIYVNEESENGLLFRNFDKDTNNKIYVNSTYCELGATTLTMNNNFVTAYGSNFTLIVKNYSDFTIETNITSTATAKVGGNTIEAVEPEITPATAQIATGERCEFVVTCEPVIPQETIISMQFEEFVPPYTIKTYNTTNITTKYNSAWDGYSYVEFGEYPAALANPSSPTATGETYTYGDNTFTIYKDANGKYAKVNSRPYYYCKFEPIRWIIVGAGANYSSKYMPSYAPETAYAGGDGTNREIGENQVLLLSEFGLYREYFDKEGSYTNQFGSSDCDVQVSLNGSFAEMAGIKQYFASTVGVNEVGKYIAKVQPGTTYADSSNNEQFDSTSSYNMFLLGLRSGSGSNVDTYRCDKYMDWMSEQMQCVPTSFASITGVSHSSDYDATYWWLRTGYYDYNDTAYYIDIDGDVSFDDVYDFAAVRPSFILNLA